MNADIHLPRARRARGGHQRALVRHVFASLVALAGAASVLTGSPVAAEPDADEGVLAAIPAPILRFPPLSTGGIPIPAPPTMVDLDLDGRSELIVVDDRGTFYVLNGLGQNFAGFVRKSIGGAPSGPVAVGDLDNDGYIEIVSVTTNGRVRVWSNQGEQEIELASSLPSPVVGGPLLTELDRSGRLAIIVATQNGQMHAFAATGAPYPGWPVTGSSNAVSGPFAYVAWDNFPRVGYLGSDRAQIFFTYGAIDPEASIQPGIAFGPATAVAGARAIFGLPDAEHVYLVGRQGALRRLDPDVVNGVTLVTTLTSLPGDSVLVQPGLLDVTGDLVPELALLAQRSDTALVYVLDGANGNPLPNFPRKYLGATPTGGIACADIGDDSAPELVISLTGGRVSCVRPNGTEAWSLTGLAGVSAPVLGDFDNDEGVDMAVITADGTIRAYSLGSAGIGQRGLEWTNPGGSPRHEGRHVLRDRATPHPFWPPAIEPENTFTTRPLIGNYDADNRPDVFWSDYMTGKTFGFNQVGGALAGTPQVYNVGSVLDAPAIGDVTGDGVFESVQATSQGRLVWGDRNGVTGVFVVENNHTLSPPSLADLNNDGILDVVVGSDTGKLYAVRLAPPVGVLPGFPVSTASPITLPAALGDIDGNGETDIVVVGGPRTIYAFPRTGVAALTGWPRQFPSGQTLTQPILIPVAGQTGLRPAFGRSTGPDSVVAHLVGANGAPLAGWPRRLTNAFGYITGPIAGDFDTNGAVDLVFSTGDDSVIVFTANGNRLLWRRYLSPGNVEVCAMVDVDLDFRPDIIAVSDQSAILGIRFNGLTVRSFSRLLITLEPGAPPVFGDLGNDGVLDMAASDLGQPILYSWGYGSWNEAASPWPMKGHDRYRTHAFSGPTVVGVEDPVAVGPPARGTGVARAVPNPSRSTVAFSHTRALAGDFEAALYDVRGRLVRMLGRGTAPALGEERTWTWDGRDEAGSAAPAGIYFYLVRDAAGTLRQKVVRLP